MTSEIVTPDVESELGHELVRYGRILQVMKTQLVDLLPTGLDPAAGQLLAWLVKAGPSRQGELAGCTFLDPSTVSRRVSQLVAQGLVERRADPGDGRAVQLVTTGAGQELFAQMRARREAIVHDVLTDWPEADIAELDRLIRRFNDDFEARTTQPTGPTGR